MAIDKENKKETKNKLSTDNFSRSFKYNIDRKILIGETEEKQDHISPLLEKYK